MAPDSKVTRPCVALSKSSAASTISGAGLRRGKCPLSPLRLLLCFWERMSDKSRDASKDFDTLLGYYVGLQPYSDGEAGAGPGDGPLTMRLHHLRLLGELSDDVGVTQNADDRINVRYSITIRQHKSLHNLIEAIPEDAWTPIPYWMDGAADVAETICTPFPAEADAAPVRLIVRRVKPTPGSQLALFAKYSYHGFITDRDGELLELEADHRRHAEIENAIRDLKYGVGLNHLPSGRFAANGAWLAVQTMAHNLARWTARIGLGERIATTKTLRRRFFSLAGRLTRSARRLTLHLPDRWPWAEKFSRALARLRAIPLPA